MRLSDFRTAIADEFGDYGRVLTRDLVLGEIDGLTAEQAISAGVNPRAIWLALCRANDVPPQRWYGANQREPKKS